MGKKYKSGMYGGKFMPFHKGHLHCLEYAVSLCDTVYLLLMHGGAQEQEILKGNSPQMELLSVENRVRHIAEIAARYPNVVFVDCDISDCRDANGEEDWDMETPLVLEKCGRFDAVFGSEPEYADYFHRAYPWATYELVDSARNDVPISATMVRAMSREEAKQWIV